MHNYYFDHSATTPLHPEVARAMLQVMQGPAGNASSMHSYGRAARRLVTDARDRIAKGIGSKPAELVFTSGGTESDNSALIGAARAMRKSGKNHIITSAVEHHAVLHTCDWLESEGFRLSVLPVDQYGYLSPETVEAAITPETGLISVMHGNNEVGTLQPIERIGEIAKARGIVFHVDAVQSLGTCEYTLAEMPVDMMSFSAHKINGPQGIGALYIRTGTPYEPLLHGGMQERKRRAGTENVAGIVGFAAAVELLTNERKKKQLYLDELRNKWIESLEAALGAAAIAVNGHPEKRLPYIANISFLGTDTETMLMNLDMAGIAASSGSACTSGALERSHVLQAMGLSDERLNSAVRFSFGMGNTEEEVRDAAQKVATIVSRIRNI